MSTGVSNLVRLKPYQYIHILDNNSNVTRTLVGPMSYTLFDHEYMVQSQPQSCVCIPDGCFCIIENPAARKPDDNSILTEKNGQVKIRIGDQEIRFTQQPFPLYPGETLFKDVTPMQILSARQSMHLKALRDFDDVEGKKKHKAGDEWMIDGPLTYSPQIEVEVVAVKEILTVLPDQALRLRARSNCVDSTGQTRRAGEEWNHTKVGAFMPGVDEEVVQTVLAHVLTNRQAIHVRAVNTFKDRFGKARQAGEEWLVTHEECATFIPSPDEKVTQEVKLTTVGPRQFCVVQDVWKSGKQELGSLELRKGLTSFFLQPGEALEGGRIKDIYVLGDDEALLMKARGACKDHKGTERKAGDRWMIDGPCEYIPPIEVQVQEKRKAIPLDANEGIYIRDIKSGHVRSHIGKTVMLTEDEELWEKPLQPLVEELLALPRLTKNIKDAPVPRPARQRWKVVTCNVPHNSLVQVYDYESKKARVILGPDLVCLLPDEEFTVLSLSGGKPKQSGQIKSLCLGLGPDFMTDILVVETLDHARLQLQLSYNWEFDQVDKIRDVIFSVSDFVGDACKAIASRIRGFVASEPFDVFHRHSTKLIQQAVFGDEHHVYFKSNGLIVTAVDIHSVDPVDPKTREALVKSVQLAIEITTKQQEATARHQASSLEQDARGRLERQLIKDKAESETHRKDLLTVESHNAAVESTGSSGAQSKAEAKAKLIAGETEVEVAKKKAEASDISSAIDLDLQRQKREAELEHRAALNDLEIGKTRALALVEAEKFKKTIQAVGKDTIKAISKAGPELQCKLLKGLGLQGYLVTDGTNPINLFNTAKGMTAMPTQATK